MPDFRIYLVDKGNRVASPPVLRTMSDDECREHIKTLVTPEFSVEAWDGAEMAHRLRHR